MCTCGSQLQECDEEPNGRPEAGTQTTDPFCIFASLGAQAGFKGANGIFIDYMSRKARSRHPMPESERHEMARSNELNEVELQS